MTEIQQLCSILQSLQWAGFALLFLGLFLRLISRLIEKYGSEYYTLSEAKPYLLKVSDYLVKAIYLVIIILLIKLLLQYGIPAAGGAPGDACPSGLFFVAINKF
jgi:hypothetical protein